MRRPERFKLRAGPRCPKDVPVGQTYCEQHGGLQAHALLAGAHSRSRA
jgi:hypothetical protein